MRSIGSTWPSIPHARYRRGLIASSLPLGWGAARASVGDETACEARLFFAIA